MPEDLMRLWLSAMLSCATDGVIEANANISRERTNRRIMQIYLNAKVHKKHETGTDENKHTSLVSLSHHQVNRISHKTKQIQVTVISRKTHPDQD